MPLPVPVLQRAQRDGLRHLSHGFGAHVEQRRDVLRAEQALVADAVHSVVQPDDRGIPGESLPHGRRRYLLGVLLVPPQTHVHPQVQQSVVFRQRGGARGRGAIAGKRLCLRQRMSRFNDEAWKCRPEGKSHCRTSPGSILKIFLEDIHSDNAGISREVSLHFLLPKCSLGIIGIPRMS